MVVSIIHSMPYLLVSIILNTAIEYSMIAHTKILSAKCFPTIFMTLTLRVVLSRKLLQRVR